MIDWINRNTGEDEVILAHYHISPVIRAYADRAVNLTSLFEYGPLREKIEEYISALFGTEDDLHQLCDKFSADYLVCSIDTILDNSDYSWRYLADHRDLDEDTLAYRMHYSPEGLESFGLVYENEYFRVYQLLTEGEEIPPTPEFVVHPLYFRADIFQKQSGSTADFKRYIENVYQVYLSGSRALASD